MRTAADRARRAALLAVLLAGVAGSRPGYAGEDDASPGEAPSPEDAATVSDAPPPPSPRERGESRGGASSSFDPTLSRAPEQVYDLEQLLLSDSSRVISAAAFREQTPEEAPSAVLVITAADIRASGARTLGEVLERYTGIEQTGGDRLLIRGVGPTNRLGGLGDANRILLLIDGTRVNDVFADTFSAGLARGVDDISRIEVIKGPGSALYGTSAEAGVIHVVTRRGEELSGVEARARIEGDRQLSLTAAAGGQKGGLEGALHTRGRIDADTQGRRTAAIEVRGSGAYKDVTITGGYLLYAHPPPPRREEPPPGEGNPPPQQGVSRVFTGAVSPEPTARAVVTSSPLAEPGTNDEVALEHRADLAIEAAHTFSRSLQSTARLSATGASSSSSNGSYTLQEGRAAGEGRLRYRVAPWLWTIGGAEGRAEAAQLADDGGDPSSWTRQVLGLYAQGEVGPFLNTTLTAGLRWEYSQASDGIDPTRHTQLSPRVGLVAALPGRTTVKAFYGQAFQSPSLALLYHRTELKDRVIEPNPALEPERLRTLEIEAGRPFGRTLQTRLNLFHNDITDFIAPAYTGTEGVLRYENQYDARIQGLEAEVTWTPLRELRTFGNVTLLHARDQRSGEALPLIPTARANLAVAASPRPGTTAWISATYVTARRGTSGDPLEPEIEIPASFRLDARLAVDVGRRWQVALAARNLLGGAGSDYQDGELISTEGREVWIEVSFRPDAHREAGW